MELPASWAETSRNSTVVSSNPGWGGLFGDEAAFESPTVTFTHTSVNNPTEPLVH